MGRVDGKVVIVSGGDAVRVPPRLVCSIEKVQQCSSLIAWSPRERCSPMNSASGANSFATTSRQRQIGMRCF